MQYPTARRRTRPLSSAARAAKIALRPHDHSPPPPLRIICGPQLRELGYEPSPFAGPEFMMPCVKRKHAGCHLQTVGGQLYAVIGDE